ncbi:MAG: carboxypeptidase regulatory-like domain-containing protein [Bacteroidetes bacterium]|nr:carboxypeptidase regulatory-like domain-containing protein [Bacteroidota bacterium]
MNVKACMLMICGLLLGSFVLGQRISGTVGYEANQRSDSTKERWGAAGETVFLMPGKLQSKTDSLGRYSFGPLAPGTYTLRTSMEGLGQKRSWKSPSPTKTSFRIFTSTSFTAVCQASKSPTKPIP